MTIDFTDFERRVEVLPPAPGNYAGLTALSGQVLYRRGTRTGAAQRPDADRLLRSERPRREDDRRQRARLLASADGKKLLVRNAQDWFIVDVRPAQKLDKKLAIGDDVDDGRSVGRVAPDVQRRVARRARLLLRSGHARRRLERHAHALRQADRRRRLALGRDVRARRVDRRAEFVAHVRAGRPVRERPATRRRTPRRRLRARGRLRTASPRSSTAASGTARCGRRSSARASR